MAEYGHDIANFRAFANTKMTIEIPLEDIPEEQLQKILGGIPIVRCKDCKHRPITERWPPEGDNGNPDMTCPAICLDSYYSWIPEDDFFCAKWEVKK